MRPTAYPNIILCLYLFSVLSCGLVTECVAVPKDVLKLDENG